MTTNVVKLPKTAAIKKTSIERKISAKQSKKLKIQGYVGVGIGTVAASLTALSLSHLAHGMTIVTGCPQWESWSMAVGIDCGFIALELGQITVTNALASKQFMKLAPATIVGLLVFSAIMNAFAFGSMAIGYWIVPAVALGIAIPALIYSLTRCAVALWLNR